MPGGRDIEDEMMNVNGVQPPVAPKAVDLAGPVTANQPAQLGDVSDVVEISDLAKLVAKVHEVPEVRTELVEKIKSEIAAGTYETPERLEIAVDRLMEELFPEA